MIRMEKYIRQIWVKDEALGYSKDPIGNKPRYPILLRHTCMLILPFFHYCLLVSVFSISNVTLDVINSNYKMSSMC